MSTLHYVWQAAAFNTRNKTFPSFFFLFNGNIFIFLSFWQNPIDLLPSQFSGKISGIIICVCEPPIHLQNNKYFWSFFNWHRERRKTNRKKLTTERKKLIDDTKQNPNTCSPRFLVWLFFTQNYNKYFRDAFEQTFSGATNRWFKSNWLLHNFYLTSCWMPLNCQCEQQTKANARINEFVKGIKWKNVKRISFSFCLFYFCCLWRLESI